MSMVTTPLKHSHAGPERTRETVCVCVCACAGADYLGTFSPHQLVLITENKWQHLVRFMGLLQRASLVKTGQSVGLQSCKSKTTTTNKRPGKMQATLQGRRERERRFKECVLLLCSEAFIWS